MSFNDITSRLRKLKFPYISYFEKEDGIPLLNDKKWQYAALLILAFIWGSSFIMMKKGLETFSAGQVAALRVFLSFIFFIPFIIRRLKKFTKENWIFIVVVGVVGNGIPAIMFTSGQTEISSSLAGILNSMTPLFTLFIGLMFFKLTTGWKNILGLIIGMAGAAGLIIQGSNHFLSGNLWYAILIIIATICYAINTNIVKTNLKGMDGLTITALAFLTIGPPAGIYLLFTDMQSPFLHEDVIINMWYILFLAFFGSFLAVTLFNILIKYTSPIFASSVTYVIPAFAVMWGTIDGEAITVLQIIWLIMILTGVYLVNLKVKNK